MSLSPSPFYSPVNNFYSLRLYLCIFHWCLFVCNFSGSLSLWHGNRKVCQQCRLSRFCQKAPSWHAFLFSSFLPLLSLVLIFKVIFPKESGRLHWAINRKFQPWSVGVGDGWERSEEDQELVWQLFESTQRSLTGLVCIRAPSGQLNEKQKSNILNTIFASALSLPSFACCFFTTLTRHPSLFGFVLLCFYAIITLPSYLIFFAPLHFAQNMLVFFVLTFFSQLHHVAEMIKIFYPPLL